MSEEKDNEIVCYILMRTDLGMSPGKMVAQGGHAVQLVLEELLGEWSEDHVSDDVWYTKWQKDGITKIVLQVISLDEMYAIINKVDMAAYLIKSVIDEGRTEIAPNTLTCAAIQPMPRKIAKQFVGHLKLLK